MIETIQDAIVTQLSTITGVGDVAPWQGDVDNLEEILQIPVTPPALHVVYHGEEFAEKKVIGANRVDGSMRFMILLVNKDLYGRKECAASSYAMIEAVLEKLKGYQISPYGFLWPVKNDLLVAVGGGLVYGLLYRINVKG